MFRKLFNPSKPKKDLLVPAAYNPKYHYNCFIETVREADRQAVYQELRRRGCVVASHILPDGRLQLAVRHIADAIQGYNAVAGQKVFVAGLSKARLLELQVTNPDMEVTALENLEKPGRGHAERIKLSQVAFGSDQAFRKGVAHQQQKQYQEAIRCYDEAIRIEPEDIRAWCSKIGALAQMGDHPAAIDAANQILGRHTDIGLLWEAKGQVLAELGRMIEAGEFMSIACELNPAIARRHAARIDRKTDDRLQALMDACRKIGKNPEIDVDYWFGRSMQFVQSSDAEGALLCLQMAAAIAPDHFVLHDKSGMALLPPGHPLLSKELLPEGAQVEPLQDFFQRITKSIKK